MDPLPIDRQLPAALAELNRAGALVLTAPPGAGKSTRLPPGLVSRVSGQTLLLQPRRVAARSLARRIAEEQHWTLGREVGWRVRFDRMGGRETLLWVMTEGTLTRQLQGDGPFSEPRSPIARLGYQKLNEKLKDKDIPPPLRPTTG